MIYGKLKINKVNYFYRIISKDNKPTEHTLKCAKLVFKSKDDKCYDIIDRCSKCKQNWIKIGKETIMIYDNDTTKLKLEEIKIMKVK
jgi:hypothetical protein